MSTCNRCGEELCGKQIKFCSERCRKKVANKRWRQKDNKKRRKRVLENRVIKKAKRIELLRKYKREINK